MAKITIQMALILDNSPVTKGNFGLLMVSMGTSVIWFNPVIKTLQSKQANRVGISRLKYSSVVFIKLGMKPIFGLWMPALES